MDAFTIKGMDLHDLYEHLASRFNVDDWWPAGSDFEIMVGAILTQNTTWTSVEKAVDALKSAGILTAEAMRHYPMNDLIELIRPAGSYTRKTRYLRELIDWLNGVGRCAEQMNTEDLRASLLKVPGIGPETADDVLLYVYRRRVFIFDTYARRLFDALGMPTGSNYEKTRRMYLRDVESSSLDVEQFARFHGLIVTAGKYARRHGWEEIFNAQNPPRLVLAVL